MAASRTSRIYVVAGVNGAGKSSIAGAAFRESGGEYYNPDEAARRLMAANRGLSQNDANGLAWQQGRRLLETAIARQLDFAFETTLGGSTIPRLLMQAAKGGADIFIWYIGLATVDLHIARVKSRVSRGGHDIPEAQIRRRFEHSRIHLIELMPMLAALRVYDNSTEADPAQGRRPEPMLLLHMLKRRIVGPGNLAQTSDWAKPVVAAALKLAAL